MMEWTFIVGPALELADLDIRQNFAEVDCNQQN